LKVEITKMSEKSECVFCKIVKGEIKAKFEKESNNFFAIKDLHPISEGHILIIPKKHFVTLLDIPDNLGEELLHFTKEIASSTLAKKQGDGFNIIMNNLAPAGQAVMHAHIHLVPRKEGDGIRYFHR